MSLIVKKFGGTSVADLDRIRHVAQIVEQTRRQGHQVVVVVSARAGVTNRLVADARALHPHPDEREMDLLLSTGEQETIALLALALHARNIPAVSRTGAQAGIQTEPHHTRARITQIETANLRKPLEEGKVVIVAGFQGRAPNGETTTFGRGGSDLSAIALAAVLKADLCQIYTDVQGVYTADPRIVPNARKLDEIAYDEMLELASMGSKVMQSRAVEFASKHNVTFEVRSTFHSTPGTIVKAEIASMEDVVVRGVAVDKNQVKVVISDLPDQPGTAAHIFQALADAQINVDMIIQNVGRGGKANLTFTIALDDTYKAEQAIATILDRLGGKAKTHTDRIAKVSVVGIGMRSHSGVAATLFKALAQAGINIQLIGTSEIKITVAINSDKADEAARTLHHAFGLEA